VYLVTYLEGVKDSKNAKLVGDGVSIEQLKEDYTNLAKKSYGA